MFETCKLICPHTCCPCISLPPDVRKAFVFGKFRAWSENLRNGKRKTEWNCEHSERSKLRIETEIKFRLKFRFSLWLDENDEWMTVVSVLYVEFFEVMVSSCDHYTCEMWGDVWSKGRPFHTGSPRWEILYVVYLSTQFLFWPFNRKALPYPPSNNKLLPQSRFVTPKKRRFFRSHSHFLTFLWLPGDFLPG